MNSKGLAQLAYEKGMYILTAAQSYQAAQKAARLGHGFLTYALVEEGLKTNAADKDRRTDKFCCVNGSIMRLSEYRRCSSKNSTRNTSKADSSIESSLPRPIQETSGAFSVPESSTGARQNHIRLSSRDLRVSTCVES